MDYNYISDATGFDAGEEFTSTEQVREYFTVSNMQHIASPAPMTDIDQRELDEMASAVIENRWHCAEEFDAES